MVWKMAAFRLWTFERFGVTVTTSSVSESRKVFHFDGSLGRMAKEKWVCSEEVCMEEEEE